MQKNIKNRNIYDSCRKNKRYSKIKRDDPKNTFNI